MFQGVVKRMVLEICLALGGSSPKSGVKPPHSKLSHCSFTVLPFGGGGGCCQFQLLL